MWRQLLNSAANGSPRNLGKKEENSQQNKLLHQTNDKPKESMSGVNLCPSNSQNASAPGVMSLRTSSRGTIKMEKMSQGTACGCRGCVITHMMRSVPRLNSTQWKSCPYQLCWSIALEGKLCPWSIALEGTVTSDTASVQAGLSGF